MTVPARTIEVARRLLSLLQPSIVIAADAPDSEPWLAELARDQPGTHRLRLVAEGAPETRPSSGELVVHRPLSSPTASRNLASVVGRRSMPVQRLSGSREARRLALGVQRLLEGRVRSAAARLGGGRPEIDLIIRHLVASTGHDPGSIAKEGKRS